MEGLSELVFVGSEAEGYYGGAYDCFGVFVSKENFDKFEGVLKEAFSYRSHGELDGKHSDVEGDLVLEELNGISDVLQMISDKQPDYDIYHFAEHIEEGAYDSLGALITHLDEIKEKVARVRSKFGKHSFMLSDEELVKVSEYIKWLRKGDE